MNAKRYARTLYQAILRGSSSELGVIADEFATSAKSLIGYATDREKFQRVRPPNDGENAPGKKPRKVIGYANDILLLIADKRFCRSIVDASPRTAWAVFHEIAETKKYGVQVETFAKNIVNAALVNRNSFLFHETEGYESGLIGYIKPLSQAMFSNHAMVETIGTLLDPDISEMKNWNSAHWKAYCRVVLMTFRDYVAGSLWKHSYVLHRATDHIERAASDLYKIDGMANSSYDDDVQARLRVVVAFIKDAVEILEKKGVPEHLRLRVRETDAGKTFYDHLADMIVEVIWCASTVQRPRDLCWWIQHNSVWSELLGFRHLNGAAGRVVKFKVRRLVYDEIARMKDSPDYRGASILGFCLNVMWAAIPAKRPDRGSKPLRKAVFSWTEKNFASLHAHNPRVAEACLVDGITYDAENLRLVKTYSANGLRREPQYDYFNLDPPPTAGSPKTKQGNPGDRPSVDSAGSMMALPILRSRAAPPPGAEPSSWPGPKKVPDTFWELTPWIT